MGLLLNGTTQCLTISSSPVTAIPISIAFWVNMAALPAQYYLLTISSTTASNHSLFAAVGVTKHVTPLPLLTHRLLPL